MKTPRGVAAEQLIRALNRMGYRAVRQKGSHVRLRHEGPPAHAITVPPHKPMKTGTLHAILAEVAFMRSTAIESLIELL